MLSTLHRSSAFLFYSTGILVLLLMVLFKRGASVAPFLHSLDLPLLLTGLLYAGSSFALSILGEKISFARTLAIDLPLGMLFMLFTILNFGFPTAQ